jgi:hypothetical protein
MRQFNQWLAIGLAFVAGKTLAADDPGWAFQPVRRAEVREEGRNPIDLIVEQTRRNAGVSPSREADRITLIRRLSLDLRGLPPTPAEIDSFLGDLRPDAYERLVDTYLASPEFGERQAVGWLDLARYADTDGFELDGRRPDAWRYRDWVVESFHTDMPYDRFIRLQIAADLVAPDAPRHKAALGFLRNGPTVANERNERTRIDEIDDIVTTTSSVFLGLTVGCARCHDHKADPIPTEDYYRLAAVFAPARPASVALATDADVAAYREASRAIEESLDTLRVERLAIERPARDRAIALSPLELAGVAECQARIDWFEAHRPQAPPEARGVVESSGRSLPVHVLIRGDLDRKGEIARAGPPRAVAGRVIDFEGSPRKALADWIADPANPLTARVEVNRIWQSHFGTALVRTPSDFGAAGDPPVMPELLDWLAAEFVARGWSRKAIHRQIVTSNIYRQASRVREDMRRIDPAERYVWHYPLRRLDAEAIRDAIFSCAGTLNPRRGGPGVFPPIDPSLVRTGNLPRWPLDATDGPHVWRRSLYLFRMRSLPLPFLETFDLPDLARSCPERTTTTVPTQGLALLNSPFIVAQSHHFAARVVREAGPDPSARITLAFRIATGRPPTGPQLRASLDYLGGPGDLAGLCQVLWNSNAFLHVD